MNRQGIREIIKRIDPNAPITRNGEWVTTRCPFARWLHSRGIDRSPSFGIVENDDGASVFHCFTCKRKGTIEMLWRQLGELDGNDYSGEIHESRAVEILGPSVPRWGAHRRRGDNVGDLQPISDEVILTFDRAEDSKPAIRYLRTRGIKRDTAGRLGLLYDPDDNHGVQRLVFAVRGRDGRLYGFTGRAIGACDNDCPRVRDYFGLEKRRLLLGAHDCGVSGGRGPITLVEGLFDYAKVRQAGYECVAALHSGLTPDQVKLLASFRRPVIVAFDNDEAGEKGKSQVKKTLGQHIPLMKVRYPAGVKDAGDMTSGEIRRMLSDTRLL